MGTKVKKETKSISGAYRHYCLHRCSVFLMDVTTLLYTKKATKEELNFYVDASKGDNGVLHNFHSFADCILF